MFFERIPLNLESQERESEINEYLRLKANELRQIGIPVNDELRIRIEAYEEIYSPETIKRDQEFVKERKREYQEEAKKKGEMTEKCIVAILNKYLGERFIVVRSSEYDDFKGVDTLLIDKKTGKPFCAVDEVFLASSETLSRKKEKVLKENFREGEEGGARIKYGIFLKRQGDRIFPYLGSLKNVPIFYLYLSPEKLEGAIESFSRNRSNPREREILNSLLFQLKEQTDFLLNQQKVSEKMKISLEEFRQRLELAEREQNFLS